MQIQPEPRVLAQLAERLRDKLPEVAPAAIDTEVASIFQTYAECRVRDFLPILVEREAIDHLSTHR